MSDEEPGTPEPPTFEQWLTWAFDHPVADPAWYFGSDDWREPPHQVAVDYLTRVFESPDEHLGRFPDDQADQGLNMLLSPSCSGHFFSFLDAKVPLEKRLRGVRSFVPLFTEYYAARCSDSLCHLDEPGKKPLNSTCYMWWDASPFHGGRTGEENERIIAACLDVMKACLASKSVACQESALHGLGHFSIHERIKADCVRLIDGFLAAAPDARPELVAYARAARAGRVQ
ncbi:MAG: hypothetical protein KGL53_06745 [Elusimicrobia bacterium]|nr:hypothetical protein [Elusimicrobiota bacterium]